MRREAERRDLMERRLGGDPYLRERERQVRVVGLSAFEIGAAKLGCLYQQSLSVYVKVA